MDALPWFEEESIRNPEGHRPLRATAAGVGVFLVGKFGVMLTPMKLLKEHHTIWMLNAFEELHTCGESIHTSEQEEHAWKFAQEV